MSIIKDGKNYGVETKIERKDEFQDQLFSQTLEEIHSTTPIKYGYNMFYKQPKLRVADVVISDNVWSSNQYDSMFEGCTQLTTTASILPATKLASACYQEMFYGCTALTEAPTLPATQLATYCYAYMFRNCTSLTETPSLPATTLYSSSYESMFLGCTALQKTGEIAATGNISSNTSSMFQNCPALKEMTWTATTPPTINSNIWLYCPSDMIIYVPDESVELYKAASVWNSRAEYIRPMSERPE